MTPHYKLYVLRKGTLNSQKNYPPLPTAQSFFRVAAAVLLGIWKEATERGYQRLSQENVSENQILCAAQSWVKSVRLRLYCLYYTITT